MRLTEITDDLTGAADSGSYFTARGRKVRICTNGRCSLEHEADEILTVNLSSRNTAQDKARQLHADLLRRLEPGGFYMKKIGTGFRGNDSYELDGLLDGWPDYNVFIVDNAPDLGTFTLYGNQYCEGEILPKSVYANDPIFPPTESYIPKILGKDTDKKIGLVDIDAVKGGEETLLAAVEHQLAEETRILVFDAITRTDVLHLLKTLAPRYPKVFWTGSLGIADGLAEYLYGPAQPHTFPVRDIRSLCFCASAYDIAHKQITYSAERGLQTVPLDIDAYIEGGKEVPQRAAKQAEQLLGQGSVILFPQVEKYSYKPGTSKAIMECFAQAAAAFDHDAAFDRLVIIGGETSQGVLRQFGVEHLQLGCALEPGVAQGLMLDGCFAGREFALKGGSMGREDTLEKMLCRKEVVY